NGSVLASWHALNMLPQPPYLHSPRSPMISQAFPHSPQLSLSDIRSTQAPLQAVRGGSQTTSPSPSPGSPSPSPGSPSPSPGSPSPSPGSPSPFPDSLPSVLASAPLSPSGGPSVQASARRTKRARVEGWGGLREFMRRATPTQTRVFRLSRAIESGARAAGGSGSGSLEPRPFWAAGGSSTAGRGTNTARRPGSRGRGRRAGPGGPSRG